MNFGFGRDRPIGRRHKAINESFPTKNISRSFFPKWHNPSISAAIGIIDRCSISVRQHTRARRSPKDLNLFSFGPTPNPLKDQKDKAGAAPARGILDIAVFDKIR
jgi:hypothetical protein